jgi:hypothetical protein
MAQIEIDTEDSIPKDGASIGIQRIPYLWIAQVEGDTEDFYLWMAQVEGDTENSIPRVGSSRGRYRGFHTYGWRK